MKKLTFAVVGAVALATGACGGGAEDQVNNAEMNQPGPELNGLAADAANTAEADALGNQQQQLETETNVAAPAETVDGNATSPSQVEDDVQGM